jgi:hypothetical protein
MFITIISIIYVEFPPYKLNHKLLMLKMYAIPEGGQQLRPKYVRVLINK